MRAHDQGEPGALPIAKTSRIRVEGMQAIWFVRLAWVAVLAYAGSILAAPLHDPDIWFHLSGGRLIFEEGRIPAEDSFTWARAGTPWIDLHWTFQCLVYPVYILGDAPALVGLKMLLGVLVVAATGLAVRASLVGSRVRTETATLLAACAVLPLLVAFSLRPILRPELLTFLWLSLQAYALARFAQGQLKWGLAVFLFQALQVNGQGLFILGWILTFACGGRALLTRMPFGTSVFGRPAEGEPSPAAYFVLALGVVGVSFLNPFGLDGFLFPFTLMSRIDGSADVFSSISEFRSAFLQFDATAALATVLAGVIVAAAPGRRVRTYGLGFLMFALVALALTALARRNLTLLGLAAAFPLGGLLAFREHLVARTRITVASVLCIGCGILAADTWNGKRLQPWSAHPKAALELDASRLPKTALAFLARKGYPYRHFVDMNVGAYDVFVRGRSAHCLVDARLEVLGRDGLSMYLSMLAHPERFEATCEEFDFQAAIIDSRLAHLRILDEHLKRSGAWARVFRDGPWSVYVKRTARNATYFAKGG